MLKLSIFAAAVTLLAAVSEATPLISFGGSTSTVRNKYRGSSYASKCYTYDWATFGDVRLVDSAMTNTVCANRCGDLGLKYSGSQSVNCYCASSAPVYTSGMCLYSCPGDRSDGCGGPGSLNVWSNADISAPTTTKPTTTSSTTTTSSSTTSTSTSTKATSTTSSSTQTSISTSTSTSSTSTSTSSTSTSTTTTSSSSTSTTSSAPTSTYVASKYQASLYQGGCFYDNAGSGGARTFGGDYTASGSMTNEVCANYCGDRSFKYSGVEYGQECMCSNQAPTVTTGATCNMPCLGNSTETCGGSWSLTVFDNAAIAAPVSAAASLSSNYQSIGCFADQVAGYGRTLNSYTFNSPNMTINMCTAKCSEQGYPYSGLEYGQECWCGSYKPKTTSSQCTMACTGSSVDTCGGPNALSVYYDQSLAAKADQTPSCGTLPRGYALCQYNESGTCVPVTA